MNSKREKKHGDFDQKEFGRRLKKARNNSNTTSVELGNACGVNPVYIRQIETGTKLPSVHLFVKICDSLQVSPAYFLGNEVQVQVTENDWDKLAYQLSQIPQASRRIVDEVLASMIQNLAEKNRKSDNNEEIYGMIDKVEFGRRLRKVRQEMKVTTQQLADNSRVSSVFIRQVEKGGKLPSFLVFVNICKTLQISPAYLLGNELKIEVTKCDWDELVQIQCDMTPNAQYIVKGVLISMIQNLVKKPE